MDCFTAGQPATVHRVRFASEKDKSFVLGLAARFGSTRAAWRTYEEVVGGTQRQLSAAFAAGDDSAVIFIAEDSGGQSCGFAYVVTDADFFTGEGHGHLSEIATSADQNGVGSALLAAVEAWSRERGFRYLSLNVNDANESALAFYERRAYQPEYRHLIKLL